MERRRQYGGGGWVFPRAIEATAVYRPQLPRYARTGALVVGERLQVVIQPDEIKGRADPSNTRDEVQPTHQQTGPIEQVGHHARVTFTVSAANGPQLAHGVAQSTAAQAVSSPAPMSCISCAATPIAIAAGHLLAMPPMPMGQISRAMAAPARPSRAKRERKRAALLFDPISPAQAKSPRVRMARHRA